MNNINIEDDAFALVRRYSLRADKDLKQNEIASAVRRVEEANMDVGRQKERINLEWQQWLRFTTETAINDDTLLLEKGCKEIAKAWEDFQAYLPSSQQFSIKTQAPPTIRTVNAVVEQTVQGWENRKKQGFGRARSGFFQFCGTLDAHSNLFKVFPASEKYTSLFAGVVTSIVKASASHEKIAEGFSQALLEISHILDQSLKQCKIYPTATMKDLVTKMYVKYFGFLCHAMNWYRSSLNRFKSSFNQDFYKDELEAKVNEVKKLLGDIVLEAGLETEKAILDTRDKTTEIQNRLRNVLTTEQMEHYMDRMGGTVNTLSRDNSHIKKQLELLALAMGQLGQGFFTANGQRHLYDQRIGEFLVRAAPTKLSLANVAEPDVSGHDSSTPEEPLSYGRVEMQVDTRFLEDHNGDKKRSDPPIVADHTMQVPGQIVIRLQSWLSSVESQTLWIIGLPHNGPGGSDATLAAAHITNLCVLGDIAHIAFFCEPTTLQTPHITQFITLLYSLIRQLIPFTPASIPPTLPLRSSIRHLDGTPTSIPPPPSP